MARIAGVELPKNKRVEVGLTYIYGIGRPTAFLILKKAKIDLNTRISDLTEEEVSKLREIIEKNYKVEGELRRRVNLDIKRLVEIGSYKGTRHKKNLPVRGQRTKTNARTKRGKRVTVGTGRRKPTEKT